MQNSKKEFSLQDVIDIVFAFGVEQKRTINSEKGKKNIELWVKAKLFDTRNQPTLTNPLKPQHHDR